MYKAILFDLDDTLYDLRSYWRERLRQAIELVRVRYPHFDSAGLIRTAVSEQVYMERWPAFLRALGVDDEILIAETHAAFRRDWFGQLALYEDTVHTLEVLRPDHRLGLITNGPSAIQRPKIERFDLTRYFDVLIVSGEVGVAKPDPAIFALALEPLGVAAHEALFVGDSPEYDWRGATAAGMPFVWMNPHGDEMPEELGQPLAVIRRIGEVLELLGARQQ